MLFNFACSRSNVTKDPIADLIKQEQKESLYTILLFDMYKKGIFSKDYKHRYRIIKEKNGKVVSSDTKWYDVPSSYFEQNANNLGMEVASKDKTGKSSRVVGPPGYTNYVGEEKYGYWSDGRVRSSLAKVLGSGIDTATTDLVRDSLGYHSVTDAKSNHWYFYPQYDYVRTLLQLPSGKIYHQSHLAARDRYHRGIVYYGVINTSGRRRYGTNGTHYSTNSYGKRWSRGGGGNGK